jgi:levansucrase
MPLANAKSQSDRQGLASRWAAEHVAAIAGQILPEAPPIVAEDVVPVVPGQDLWDIWPVQNPDGSVAAIAGGQLWMILSAPKAADPGARHDVARTRLLFRRPNGGWADCGLLFPDDLNPGSREWSGAARLDAEGRVTAWFTAAGRRGDCGRSFEQRLFVTSGQLDLSGDLPRIGGWSAPRPLVANDGTYYVDLRLDQGVPGNIRGFRDPYWLRDPADGRAYILFTGSLARSPHSHNGVIGLARAVDEQETGFHLLPPIISSDGLCNELERPHLIFRDGLYYLFWSSQKSVFAPDGPKGPTGLYGMVAPSLTGPYEPLNGTGLVICNPVEEPRQAYCWQVLDSLEVISFIDHWGLQGRDLSADPNLMRQQFGGTIAPMLRIEIDGNRTRMLGRA